MKHAFSEQPQTQAIHQSLTRIDCSMRTKYWKRYVRMACAGTSFIIPWARHSPCLQTWFFNFVSPDPAKHPIKSSQGSRTAAGFKRVPMSPPTPDPDLQTNNYSTVCVSVQPCLHPLCSSVALFLRLFVSLSFCLVVSMSLRLCLSVFASVCFVFVFV